MSLLLKQMRDWQIGDRLASMRAACALACAGMFLSACGFQPLYGPTGTTGRALNDVMAAVDIAPIPGRTGQQIRNELVFKAGAQDSVVPQEYRLEVATREAIQSVLVKRDGDAKAQIVTIDATFKLIRLSDRSVAFEGKSFSRATFERFESIYSNIRARRDAENRAAKTVADGIRMRIAAYLSKAA